MAKKSGKYFKKKAKTKKPRPLSNSAGTVGKPSSQSKRTKLHQESAHPILAWIGRATGAPFSIGGVAMTFSLFWLGVFLTYIGGLICVLELCFDPWIRRKSAWIKFIGVAIVLCLLLIFSGKVVYVSAPLDTFGILHPGQRSLGTEVAGIRWRPEFTDLRVSLANPTDDDYREVDVFVEPDEPIALIGQLSSVPGVSFMGDVTKEQTDVGGAVLRPPIVEQLTEEGRLLNPPINIPMTQAIAPRYRIRCQSIIKKSGIELVLAIAGIDCSKTTCLKIGFTPDNIALRLPPPILIPSADYDKDVFTRRVPSKIKIYGTYMAGKPPRSKSINETRQVVR